MGCELQVVNLVDNFLFQRRKETHTFCFKEEKKRQTFVSEKKTTFCFKEETRNKNQKFLFQRRKETRNTKLLFQKRRQQEDN